VPAMAALPSDHLGSAEDKAVAFVHDDGGIQSLDENMAELRDNYVKPGTMRVEPKAVGH